MRWISKADRLMNLWEPWFAWRPVKTITGTWVWLERVERTHYMNDSVSPAEHRKANCATYVCRISADRP